MFKTQTIHLWIVATLLQKQHFEMIAHSAFQIVLAILWLQFKQSTPVEKYLKQSRSHFDFKKAVLHLQKQLLAVHSIKIVNALSTSIQLNGMTKAINVTLNLSTHQ